MALLSSGQTNEWLYQVGQPPPGTVLGCCPLVALRATEITITGIRVAVISDEVLSKWYPGKGPLVTINWDEQWLQQPSSMGPTKIDISEYLVYYDKTKYGDRRTQRPKPKKKPPELGTKEARGPIDRFVMDTLRARERRFSRELEDAIIATAAPGILITDEPEPEDAKPLPPIVRGPIELPED